MPLFLRCLYSYTPICVHVAPHYIQEVLGTYLPTDRIGFCVSPGTYQDCFLPHPLQLFTSYLLTVYSLSYSEYHEINCEYATVCQVVSLLLFFALSHPTLHNAAKKKYHLSSKNYEVPRYIFFLRNIILK